MPYNSDNLTTPSTDSSCFLTNQEFSDQEKQYIPSVLVQATDELQEVQHAEVTTSHRARARRRKAQVSNGIFHYKVALAPHKILSGQVLQLIFQRCIPQGKVCVPGPKVKPWLRLTCICSPWRTLAINTPELWREVATELHHYLR